MFGQIATRYDFLNHFLSFGVDYYWRRRATRLAPPVGDGPLLDVCTGTGDLALAYWRAGGKRLHVVAADFCHEMLVVGRKKVERAGAGSNVSLIEADSERLPFDNDRFQVVSVAFGLRNLSDLRCGLGELVRVCRPGGRVVVLEFSMPIFRPFRAVYGWYFRKVLPKLGQALAKNRLDAYNYLPESVQEFPQGEVLVERMADAGLSSMRHYPLTFGVATLYVGVK